MLRFLIKSCLLSSSNLNHFKFGTWFHMAVGTGGWGGVGGGGGGAIAPYFANQRKKIDNI